MTAARFSNAGAIAWNGDASPGLTVRAASQSSSTAVRSSTSPVRYSGIVIQRRPTLLSTLEAGSIRPAERR
jgi:hypothetical protein